MQLTTMKIRDLEKGHAIQLGNRIVLIVDMSSKSDRMMVRATDCMGNAHSLTFGSEEQVEVCIP